MGHLLSNGAKGALYEDFSAPSFDVEEVAFADHEVLARLKVDSRVTKLELMIDDRSVTTIHQGFGEVCYRPNGELSPGSHRISFLAYDQLLNCGRHDLELAV